MTPGEWRSRDEPDVQIGRHLLPLPGRIADFMAYFYSRFAFEPKDGMRITAVGAGKAKRILAMATANHRFNWVHLFPDGNGRVSRLMSHAMAQKADIGAHWSVVGVMRIGARSGAG
ncbi:Fic family protein (plasmid) [Novosphingobium sp. BL-8A]|uniref:Fic family protein n=1 Tax=Novosphingobium sp. BL-8A TaxID=3127639 RepID=UPI003757E78D